MAGGAGKAGYRSTSPSGPWPPTGSDAGGAGTEGGDPKGANPATCRNAASTMRPSAWAGLCEPEALARSPFQST